MGLFRRVTFLIIRYAVLRAKRGARFIENGFWMPASQDIKLTAFIPSFKTLTLPYMDCCKRTEQVYR